MNPKEKLCLALDLPSLAEIEPVVEELVDFIGLFKIGSELFTAEGPRAINYIQGLGGKIFLDLKYHDIPNTVSKAGRIATRMGVEIFNVHASGGKSMLEAVVQSVNDEVQKSNYDKPLILAVTVLTSLSSKELNSELNILKESSEQVANLARLSQTAGVDGVIASPKEIEIIRNNCGNDFIILTPGIRPKWASEKGDQKRITTPSKAIRDGADYIVVGRPILMAKNKKDACKRILEEIEIAMK